MRIRNGGLLLFEHREAKGADMYIYDGRKEQLISPVKSEGIVTAVPPGVADYGEILKPGAKEEETAPATSDGALEQAANALAARGAHARPARSKALERRAKLDPVNGALEKLRGFVPDKQICNIVYALTPDEDASKNIAALVYMVRQYACGVIKVAQAMLLANLKEEERLKETDAAPEEWLELEEQKKRQLALSKQHSYWRIVLCCGQLALNILGDRAKDKAATAALVGVKEALERKVCKFKADAEMEWLARMTETAAAAAAEQRINELQQENNALAVGVATSALEHIKETSARATEMEAKLAEETSARVKAEATANKLAFGFGVFALLAVLVLKALEEPALDSVQGPTSSASSKGKLDASLVSSFVEAVQAHEAREAGRVKATAGVIEGQHAGLGSSLPKLAAGLQPTDLASVLDAVKVHFRTEAEEPDFDSAHAAEHDAILGVASAVQAHEAREAGRVKATAGVIEGQHAGLGSSLPKLAAGLQPTDLASVLDAVKVHFRTEAEEPDFDSAHAAEHDAILGVASAPIKLAVSAEEMEKVNATKVEVLALTNALDACVNIAGRVCFLGLKDAFTFNAAVEMTFAHEAIDVEEHEADHEAIVELIDAALASLDAKPAGAMKAIQSALVAHYAFVSE
ncbi:hypothetical protein EMIHUDRAFT_452756 [Emiliania huxleyi CCMP1516]|uniref:Uncharacterized protein n=2 Tax=Emiliania huxleyi TaxID=2903 RepID=A0A0D3IFD1_EMIH1|nr:hypothetical protein EMIHUDRAFT_452756 [Emiliania huxleyi CCMP1516]EOD09966.1 hypothetical protein EMIHUDRAFT_452756 [Emiliania huxleyi CCMP1516]|eukprot:XP_005762395.1 hypothetical protein EMIHUDRAFT_452756 [Emiliania huxleyi CCMP1516]